MRNPNKKFSHTPIKSLESLASLTFLPKHTQYHHKSTIGTISE